VFSYMSIRFTKSNQLQRTQYHKTRMISSLLPPDIDTFLAYASVKDTSKLKDAIDEHPKMVNITNSVTRVPVIY